MKGVELKRVDKQMMFIRIIDEREWTLGTYRYSSGNYFTRHVQRDGESESSVVAEKEEDYSYSIE